MSRLGADRPALRPRGRSVEFGHRHRDGVGDVRPNVHDAPDGCRRRMKHPDPARPGRVPAQQDDPGERHNRYDRGDPGHCALRLPK